MSPSAGKPVVAIIDSKNLRRASITSFLEPWANSEDLRLTSFNLDQAHEAVQVDTNLRMVLFSIGGESVAEPENLQQQKFHSGIDAELACEALSFILHGGSYFPPSAMHQLQTQPEQAKAEQANTPRVDRTGSSELESSHGRGTNGNGSADSIEDYGHRPVNLTVREQEVLDHVHLGESNKVIARQLGLTEGTVKVHVRQLMRKFRATNRTQLALGWSLTAEHRSAADGNALAERSVRAKMATHREQNLRLITPSIRARRRNLSH